VFQVRQGKVQSRREFDLEARDLEVAALYATVMTQYYGSLTPPREIYLPALPRESDLIAAWLGERRGGRVRLRVPRRGEKRKLLDLVTRNAQLQLESRFRLHHTHGVEGLSQLATVLGLDEPPFRIECFDVSNTQGTDSVASMVVWEGGKPRKSDYRIYNIREVRGADDFASIAEAVKRRYRRLLREDKRLPDLVLIDGGAGQLGAAVSALTREGLPTLPVASLAKREEEIYLVGRREPVRLDRSSPALRLIQQVRDEAHRFAVTRHRRRRSRRTVRTELTDIPGIGPVTARKLLREFGSLRAVRSADAEALAAVAGPRAARAIAEHYAQRPG